MKSSYKRIRDYILLVDERNRGLVVQELLGLSISKQFISSVANTIGSDMENYKIIRRNQFACSTMQVRRDKKMPVALLRDKEEAIISQAYSVFAVKDESKLLPDYLMMWFERSEFDREACFHAVGGVRGSLEWEDFEEMKLPIPHIDKQREIVKEYNAIQNRIALNEQMIKKLEETAQAIYREWFVEFEFPDENGKPYKSSGGEMAWCEELGKDIPSGWENVNLSSIIEIKDGTHDSPAVTEKGFPLVTSTHLNPYDLSMNETYFISEEDFIQTNKRSKVEKYDILFSMIGTVGLVNYVLYDEIKFAIKNVGLFKTSKRNEIAGYILFYLKSDYMKGYLASNPNGSTQNYVTLGFLRSMPILLPLERVLSKFEVITEKIIETIHEKTIENQRLTELKGLLLSRLASVEL